ncbi:MAG: putative rane protein, partial [Verrucomicrobia bacterium]|nr:putative rane protein [Verrucomicrobiota bacterium]
ASADTMASSVAGPLERALANVPDIDSMSSSNSIGRTQIIIQFALDRNIDAAAQDVQAAINAAAGELPKDLPNPPRYQKVNPNDFTLISLAVSSDTMPITDVYRYADEVIARAISRVPGIGVVDYHGAVVPGLRVQVNPTALAARGLDLEDVRTALASTTANTPKGTLAGSTQTQLIDANDQMFKAEAYNDQVISWRNGSPTRVSDVGRAFDSTEELNVAGWTDKKRAVMVDVHKQTGARIDIPGVVDAVKALLPELRAAAPASMRITVVSDTTETIRASFKDVQVTLAITIGLVAFVMFVFLREFTATVISSLSIPLSLLGTFPVMYLLGFSLDNISLMGLTISVGFVVDDAVVVLENIVRHVEMGKPKKQAAIDGAAEVGFTVLSMTLSLAAVFLPLLLMSGIVGRLFREFSVTVIVAIVWSAIISLTQTAVAASLFAENPKSSSHGRLYQATERAFDRVLAAYQRGLAWIIGHQRFALGLTFALCVGSAVLFAVIPRGFIPEQDNGIVSITTEARPDISFAEMSEKHLKIVDLVLQDPDVANVFSYVEPHPATNNGRMKMILKPYDQRSSTAVEVMARLRPKFKTVPGVRVYMKAQQSVSIGAGYSKTLYQYVLQDSDAAELFAFTRTYQQELQKLPQLQDVGSDVTDLASSVRIIVDRDKANLYGITTANIDQILYDAFGQRQIATLYTSLNQRKVILEVPPDWQLDARSLDALQIRSPKTSQMIPLSAFTHVEQTLSPLTIGHLGTYPTVTVSFNLAASASLSDAVRAVHDLEKRANIPPSVKTSFQGSTKAFQDSLSSQPLLIAAAILTVYIILGVLYESFLHPITILSSLPSATFGALLAMYLLHVDLSVITIIALILLVGIVKKNSIMMVDVALGLQREEGKGATEAIVTACVLRFRPIMMTTMAALFGAIPLAMSAGAGFELRRPLGIAIIGGLLVSQFVTLFTVPVIFLYMNRLIEWNDRRRKSRAPLVLDQVGDAA